jgi:hypothetical protein
MEVDEEELKLKQRLKQLLQNKNLNNPQCRSASKESEWVT